VFRRLDDGRWTLSEAVGGEKIRLASVDVELVVDEIYRDPSTAPPG
jgi:hypothetical protein